jgi:hypothetical protein
VTCVVVLLINNAIEEKMKMLPTTTPLRFDLCWTVLLQCHELMKEGEEEEKWARMTYV